MGEESHRLHDILPLLVALNGETEERERGDGTGEDKSSNLARVDICVVRKYVDHVMPRSVRSSGCGADAHGGTFPKGLAWLGVINPDAMLF